MHGIGKRIVYIRRSDADPSHHCTGITAINTRSRFSGTTVVIFLPGPSPYASVLITSTIEMDGLHLTAQVELGVPNQAAQRVATIHSQTRSLLMTISRLTAYAQVFARAT